MEENKIIRRRVNFSQSTKNMVTADITFEGTGVSEEEVLNGAKSLLEKALEIAKEKSIC